jgi:NifU-like protein involved in Fe-S cluster formation
MVAGKTIEEARMVSKKSVLEYLGGLPMRDRHCALLAASATMAAIRDYEEIRRDPWKKTYRVK